MMQRRTVRIIAHILIFILGTVAVEGYDVLSGGNITQFFYQPGTYCFG